MILEVYKLTPAVSEGTLRVGGCVGGGPSNLQAIITNIQSFAEGLEQEKVEILLRPAISKQAG